MESAVDYLSRLEKRIAHCYSAAATLVLSAKDLSVLPNCPQLFLENDAHNDGEERQAENPTFSASLISPKCAASFHSP